MSNCLFYTTRAIGGREGPNICRHFSILKNHHDNIDFLTSAKTNASKIKIQQSSMIHIDNTITNFSKYYETDAKKFTKWSDIYNDINVKSLKDYDALYIIGGLDFHNSKIGRHQSRCGIFPNDGGQIKFQSLGIHLTNILALLKAHREYGISLHEIAFDPNEMSCDLFHKDVNVKDNYYLYHGYDIPKYNMNRLDSLQYHLTLKEKNDLFSENNDKLYDFTFGYTILNDSGRQHYPEYINSIKDKFKVANLYCKNEFAGENTLISGDDYINQIKQSRFTFMLPSYDNHCFSIYRFIESIQNNCLTLIHPDCNIKDVNDSFNMDLSPLVTDVIPTERDRLDLLNHYKTVIQFDMGFK